MNPMYGQANGNGHEARRLYHEKVHRRSLPKHSFFASRDIRLLESGSFTNSNAGNERL